jgi:hypothetical protein
MGFFNGAYGLFNFGFLRGWEYKQNLKILLQNAVK